MWLLIRQFYMQENQKRLNVLSLLLQTARYYPQYYTILPLCFNLLKGKTMIE